MGATIETLKLVAEGGSIVLLAAVLYGIFGLANKWAPPLVAAVQALVARIAALEAKVDSLSQGVAETRSRASEIAEAAAEQRGASDPIRRRP